MRGPFLIAAGFVGGLAASSAAVAQFVFPRSVEPVVLSGGDVGFRIEGERGGTPVGRIVVMRDGQWIEAEIGDVNPNLRP